jgi:hypothetical protein
VSVSESASASGSAVDTVSDCLVWSLPFITYSLIALLAVVAVGAGATISSSGSAVVTGSAVALMLLCVFLLFLLLMMVLASVFELGTGKPASDNTTKRAEDAMVHLMTSIPAGSTASSTACKSAHQTAITFSSGLTTVRRLVWGVRGRLGALVRSVAAVTAVCLGGVFVAISQGLLGLAVTLLVRLVASLLSLCLVVLRATVTELVTVLALLRTTVLVVVLLGAAVALVIAILVRRSSRAVALLLLLLTTTVVALSFTTLVVVVVV